MYLEHEGIKKISLAIKNWFEAKKKVVKVVSPSHSKALLPHFQVQADFMERDIIEVVSKLKSIKW
jgi:hypothetical protein